MIATELIPVTEEFLKDNGWNEVGACFEWCDGRYVQMGILKRNDISFEILCASKGEFTWKGVEINSVHKLQLALRLCGFDEVADNLKLT